MPQIRVARTIKDQRRGVFERVIEKQIAGINEELAQLKTEAERLKKEIVELNAESVF